MPKDDEPKRPRIFIPASKRDADTHYSEDAGGQSTGGTYFSGVMTPAGNRPKSTIETPPSAYQMLKDAVKVLPAMKYAQGVLGIVCVIVIIGLFKLNLFFAALGVVTLLGLMFGLLLFAIAAKQPHSVFKAPAIIMIWAFVISVLGMLGLAISCIFWKKPISYPELIAQFASNPTVDYEKQLLIVNLQKDEISRERNDLAAQKELLSQTNKRLTDRVSNAIDFIGQSANLEASVTSAIRRINSQPDTGEKAELISKELDKLDRKTFYARPYHEETPTPNPK